MEVIVNGLQLIIKKCNVGEIYKVQVKESTDDQWEDLNTEIQDIRDVYMIKFKGKHKKRYDFRMLTSKITKGSEPFLLFEAKEQLVYGVYKFIHYYIHFDNVVVLSF